MPPCYFKTRVHSADFKLSTARSYCDNVYTYTSLIDSTSRIPLCHFKTRVHSADFKLPTARLYCDNVYTYTSVIDSNISDTFVSFQDKSPFCGFQATNS